MASTAAGIAVNEKPGAVARHDQWLAAGSLPAGSADSAGSGTVPGPTTPRWSAERRGPGFARDAPRLASVASRPTSATTGSTPPGAPPAPTFRGRVTKRTQRGCKRKARTRPQDCGAGTKKRTLFDIVNGNDASGPLGSGARRAITSAATRSGPLPDRTLRDSSHWRWSWRAQLKKQRWLLSAAQQSVDRFYPPADSAEAHPPRTRPG